MQLSGDGGATFTAKVVDNNKSSGIGFDSFALTVYDNNGVKYKDFTALLLQGGNVVIHMK